MYRNSPVRIPRSKGLKIKHVLQLCLLVAVCFWLIFQVKRSHDKRREIDGNDSKISRTASSEEILKLGRKDLHPKLDNSMKETEKKHEEHEEKMEEEKDDGRGGGDEIDENEQEKIAQEEEDMKDEEDREGEESDEKEIEEKDGQSQTEKEVYVEDHDQDGGSKVTREAREEHYKADDASSAVTHGSQTVENGTLDNSTENLQANINGSQNSPMEVKVKVKDDETHGNVTVSGDSIHNTKETGKSSNSLTISDSNVSIAEGNISGSSETEGISDAIQGENTDTNNVIEETDESSDSFETDNPDEIEHDIIDSIESLHLEEKEIRNDLDTLPEIETEGGNEEDSAAE